MRAYEFSAKVTGTGSLELPAALLELLSADQTVRVMVLVEEPSAITDQISAEDEDAAWERFGVEQLFRQYSPADAIYDHWQPSPGVVTFSEITKTAESIQDHERDAD